jgi:hypothetical protein
LENENKILDFFLGFFYLINKLIYCYLIGFGTNKGVFCERFYLLIKKKEREFKMGGTMSMNEIIIDNAMNKKCNTRFIFSSNLSELLLNMIKPNGKIKPIEKFIILPRIS